MGIGSWIGTLGAVARHGHSVVTREAKASYGNKSKELVGELPEDTKRLRRQMAKLVKEGEAIGTVAGKTEERAEAIATELHSLAVRIHEIETAPPPVGPQPKEEKGPSAVELRVQSILDSVREVREAPSESDPSEQARDEQGRFAK